MQKLPPPSFHAKPTVSAIPLNFYHLPLTSFTFYYSLLHVAPVISMEERDHQLPFNQQHLTDHTILQNTIFTDPNPLSENQPEPLFGAGTYVVQVPKDQVFRVPPLENRRRVQHSTSPRRDGQRCCFGCSTCLCVTILVVMIIVVVGIVGAVIFLTEDDPTFRIERVTFTKPPPGFNFRVQVENPNKYKVVTYDPQRDSDVRLKFKEKEIAKGKFPSNFDQDPKNTTTFGIVLRGGSNLPKETTQSTNNGNKNSKSGIPLTLSMNVGVQFKVVGQVINSKRIDVTCSLTVDRLDKDTKILNQDCSIN
ncbi:OLC1v1017444C1 [Oldenlandia corymbosa var. corymbosa]|uniref:OLC1v1017444C1 n=1 Tax=Oldenlandia corymbosa var. corymbosa TaxID=529605 RepID=A0AAV1E9E0_OLDCO|nr:OLC1v1017444C1 [Oldenlandia corymbosa var. corymbosa]